MEEKSIYFFVKYNSTQKENTKDIDFVVPEKSNLKPVCIYIDDQYENQIYYYNKIFKVNKLAGKGKKGNNYYCKIFSRFLLFGNDKYFHY